MNGSSAFAKVGVAGSNPVVRSKKTGPDLQSSFGPGFLSGGVCPKLCPKLWLSSQARLRSSSNFPTASRL